MSKFLNNKKQKHFPDKKSNFGSIGAGKDIIWKVHKPCKKCGFCPYGFLVEAYPIHPRGRTKVQKKVECNVFGHDCPAYYIAEPFSE